MMLSVILLYIDDTTLYSKCDQIYLTRWTGARNGMMFSMLENFNWVHLTGLITGAINLEMDRSVFEEKSSCKML